MFGNIDVNSYDYNTTTVNRLSDFIISKMLRK